jgi:large subunit ribosomal protein L24
MAKGLSIGGSFSARLSPGLIKEYSVKSMPIRKGDTVIIKQGTFRDIEGKITRIDHEKALVYVEGVTREKSDGNTIFMPIHSSKVIITKLNLDDNRRKDVIKRKTFKPPEEVVEKPKTRIRRRSTKKRASTVKKTKDNEDKDDA